eukprot:c4123_g1_i2 orf=89-364(+)
MLMMMGMVMAGMVMVSKESTGLTKKIELIECNGFGKLRYANDDEYGDGQREVTGLLKETAIGRVGGEEVHFGSMDPRRETFRGDTLSVCIL